MVYNMVHNLRKYTVKVHVFLWYTKSQQTANEISFTKNSDSSSPGLEGTVVRGVQMQPLQMLSALFREC